MARTKVVSRASQPQPQRVGAVSGRIEPASSSAVAKKKRKPRKRKEGKTRAELLVDAKRLGIKRRHCMLVGELRDRVRDAEK